MNIISSSIPLKLGCFVTGLAILLASICARYGLASPFLLIATALFLVMLPFLLLWEFSNRVGKGQIGLLRIAGAILICLGLLYFYGNPSERLTANNDQGIYGLTAFNILHKGSSKIILPRELSPELLDQLATSQPMQAIRSDPDSVRHAFYMDMPLYTENHSYLLSQFPEAFPTSMAALGSVIGTNNLIWINWLWLFILSGIAAIIGERLGGRTVGAVFFLATLVSPLHIWVANRLFSELMLSACVGFTVLGIEWSLKSDKKSLPLSVASIWCSLALMTKIEGVLVVAIFICFVGFFIWKLRKIGYLGLVILPVVVLSQSISIYQFESLLSSVKNLWLPGLVALFLLPVAFYAIKSLKIRISDKQSRVFFLIALAGMVLIFFFFYFVYPILMKEDTFYYWPKERRILSLRGESFRRMGWYLTPLGLFLAVTGQVLLTRIAIRKHSWGILSLLLLGILTLLLLSYDILNNPLQPYAMRRFVGYTTPVLAYGITIWWLAGNAFSKKWIRLGASVLVVGVLIFMGNISWKLKEHGDHHGFLKEIHALSGKIEGKWILIDQKSFLMEITPALEVLYGIHTVSIPTQTDTAAFQKLDLLLSELSSHGEPITFLADTRRRRPRIHGNLVEKATFKDEMITTSLVQSYDSFPAGRAIQRWRYWGTIYSQ